MKSFEAAVVVGAVLVIGFLLFKHLAGPSSQVFNVNPTGAFAPGFSQNPSDSYT